MFSQKNSQLNIRDMSGFMCFRWLPIREKNLFFAILPFWRLFIGFYLRTLNSRAKFFEKSATNSRRLKTIYEFLQKVAVFKLFRCLPIDGIFYRRTNSAFSTRYISEQILCLNLRHGCVRQSMGSMDSKFGYCPHKYIIAIREEGGCGW